MARRQELHRFEAAAEMLFESEHLQQMAGLSPCYNATKYHYLYVSGDEDVGEQAVRAHNAALTQASIRTQSRSRHERQLIGSQRTNHDNGKIHTLKRCLSAVLAVGLCLGAAAADSPGPEPAPVARQLALESGVPLSSVRFENDYAPRVDFGAPLEPAGGIIHGAGQDPESYLEYSRLFDPAQRPVMQMTYITLTRGPEAVIKWQREVEASLASLAGQNTTLQIGLNLTAGLDDGSGRAGAVADGQYDPALDAFVAALESFGVPSWLRIGYEFEGDWNGYTPEGYVAAFRYITERVRRAGLRGVATVWCAAGGSAGWLEFDALMRYYPGDDYVDWWGVDTFSPEELGHSWLAGFYARAAEHGKPVMIGEATPRYVGADKGWDSWLRWYKPFFEMIRRHPEIKAISYINWDWAYWSEELGFSWLDWEDARVQQDERVRKMWIEELSQPIWVHAPQVDLIEP